MIVGHVLEACAYSSFLDPRGLTSSRIRLLHNLSCSSNHASQPLLAKSPCTAVATAAVAAALVYPAGPTAGPVGPFIGSTFVSLILSVGSPCEHQFQNNAYIYRFHQLITYYNIKYRSIGRISASSLISNDLTPKIRRVYQITIKSKALYSLERALNSARLIGRFLSITVGRELTG